MSSRSVGPPKTLSQKTILNETSKNVKQISHDEGKN